MSRVFVIGAGSWGAALAQAAAVAGHEVRLIGRDARTIDELNHTHRLPAYLGETVLDAGLIGQTGYAELEMADLLLLVVPAQASRATLEGIGAARLSGKPVILCAKGLEQNSNLRQSEILAQCAPEAMPLVLSGPSFAHDVARGRPTAVTLAADDIGVAEEMAGLLASSSLRPYASDDLIGVELCGALKNVYALGAGAIEGAELGLSARSAFLARAFAELARLVVAAGGIETTLSGLAGIGDLALSCTSSASRNYAFGMALGRGDSVEAIRASGMGLAEGMFTAPVALDLARRLGVEVPLLEAANLLLSGRLTIGDIVDRLMTRPLRREG